MTSFLTAGVSSARQKRMPAIGGGIAPSPNGSNQTDLYGVVTVAVFDQSDWVVLSKACTL